MQPVSIKDLVWTLYPINRNLITTGRVSFNTLPELLKYVEAVGYEEFLVKQVERGSDPVVVASNDCNSCGHPWGGHGRYGCHFGDPSDHPAKWCRCTRPHYEGESS